LADVLDRTVRVTDAQLRMSADDNDDDGGSVGDAVLEWCGV